MRLTRVSMQGIRQRLIFLMEVHQLRRRVRKVEKQRQIFFSIIHPKAVQVQKQTFSWKCFGHQKSIRKKNSPKKKVSFQVPNDSLA